MAKISREQASELLEAVRTPIDRLGIKVGLSVTESEDVLEAYLDLFDKFERVTACR